MINLDEVTELKSSSIFELRPLTPRAEERRPEMIMGISFGVDLDLKVI